jgi:hypothetical protein
MDLPDEKKPKPHWIQPCRQASLIYSTPAEASCEFYHRMIPVDHCGPGCSAFLPVKGNA